MSTDAQGTYLLFQLPVPRPAGHGAYVTGHLAALDPVTGHLSTVGVAVTTGAMSPVSPVYAAW